MLNSSEEKALWINAMRYCIGRQTYAVDEFIQMCKRNWDDLRESTRVALYSDLMRDSVSSCPEATGTEWRELFSWMGVKLGQEEVRK